MARSGGPTAAGPSAASASNVMVTGLIVRRHDSQNPFATDVAGAHIAVGLANLLSGEVVDRRDRDRDVAAGYQVCEFGPDARCIGLFLGVGVHPEALHGFLVDEGVDAVWFNAETDRERDIARSEGVDVAVDAVGCEATPADATIPARTAPAGSPATSAGRRWCRCRCR